ncbi:MAG: ASCH domain-containing protein [Clostridia bacterium]|nr:ASCH domain-containing protein [Clostridia bacterium]
MVVTVKGKAYNVLPLPIKKQWYDMIRSGEKKEEYRKLGNYYRTRFHSIGLFTKGERHNLLLYKATDSVTAAEEGYIMFRNGYSGNSPSFIARCTLEIGHGKPEWGAEKGEIYYILNIKEIIA